MKPSEYQNQAWVGPGSHLHKASFIKRRLFYLNHHRHTCTCVQCKCCEEGAFPDEAISVTIYKES